MPPVFAGSGVVGHGRGRKDPEPCPLPAGIGIFPLQGIGQRHPFGPAVPEVLVENPARPGQVELQLHFQRLGQNSDPVLVTLAGPDRQGASFEIDVLDAQVGALLDPQPASVDQFGHQQVDTLQVCENAPDFLTAQDHRQAAAGAGPDGFTDIGKVTIKDVPEEKEQSAERLVLGRGGDLLFDGDVAEEAFDVRRADLGGSFPGKVSLKTRSHCRYDFSVRSERCRRRRTSRICVVACCQDAEEDESPIAPFASGLVRERWKRKRRMASRACLTCHSSLLLAMAWRNAWTWLSLSGPEPDFSQKER